MQLRDFGVFVQEEIERIVQARLTDLIEGGALKKIRIAEIKTALQSDPNMLKELMKEIVMDADWMNEQIDTYFSGEPTPLFTASVREALEGETA